MVFQLWTAVEKIPTCCLSKGVADLIERSTIVGVYLCDGSANGRLVCRGPQGGHFYLTDSGLLMLLNIDNLNELNLSTNLSTMNLFDNRE
ncbi:unnamed protein product [Brachionus calyciflorus]|uniref:Uncharacterized protein n=1 Tax=Brachionus calyciflorus TaxID=104777 RepID=A0A814EBF1_9BILA|nr:unnamed protein product [Brachionus calyciflorus]